MFGATPGSFYRLDACQIAAEAYALEEGCEYVVVTKNCANGTVYRPTERADIKIAEEEGWKVVS